MQRRPFDCLLATLLAAALAAPAAAQQTPAEPATPQLKGQDAVSRQAVAAVARVVPRYHLSGHPLDEVVAGRALKLFLDGLDGEKLYFLQADVDGFRRGEAQLAEELKKGDLQLAYRIAKSLAARTAERLQLVEQLLAEPVDFTVDETYDPAADAESYAATADELRERWRKRIKYNLLVHKVAGADAEEARRRTLRTYRAVAQQWQGISDAELLETFLKALVHAYGPHSNYISAESYADFVANSRQQIMGVGAQLQVKDGYAAVVSVVDGGPADKAGQLKAGDRIIAVGEGQDGELVDVIGAPLRDVVAKIRGTEGSKVRLRVLKPGAFEADVYTITRGRINTAAVASAVLTGENLPGGRAGKVGYVHVPDFYRDTAAQQAGKEDYRSAARDLRRELAKLVEAKVDVVVLDLRNHPGGNLGEMVEAAGAVLGQGPVVQSKDAGGKVQAYAAQGGEAAWKGPLVVLTNRVSAGGAEYFAAAVQDYERGLLVGDDRTFGMGTIASIVDLGRTLYRDNPNPPKLGYLTVTSARFYRPGGEGTLRRGTLPHIALPSVTSSQKYGEEYLDYALKYDAINPTTFTKAAYPITPQLRDRLTSASLRRRAASEWFRQLEEAIRKQLAAATAVPLNEQAYRAAKAAQLQPQDAPQVPGIPQVKRDAYLDEVLSIALDYADQAK